ncbi:MAG TPA: glycosyltransferase [Ferruginibacter sp.]|nr:glycosyltransferase [Ferruginibacter sp.]
MKDEKKIRLLIFVPTLQCGGSEKFISLLCNNINTSKFSICLAVLQNKNQFYEITNTAVTVIDFGTSRVRFALFKIKRLIKQYQPDIVFSAANHINLYLAIFRKMFSKNIKFIARESSIVSLNSKNANMPGLYDKLIKKYYKRFDIIVCQSKYMQQDLVANYNITADKTVVINNAILPKNVNENLLKQNKESNKFITVSRLSPEKGIERLIHAVGLLSIPFEFYIIGSGKQKAALQKLVTDLDLTKKVFFIPENKTPFEGMEDADLFLLGSYYEGFPNTLLEAGALGIPAVAFDAAGGIREIIENEKNGLLVDDNDIIGFATAITSALNNKFNRQQIANSTVKRFSADKMIATVEELFCAIL